MSSSTPTMNAVSDIPQALQAICKDDQVKLSPNQTAQGRYVSSVSADVERLLSPKSRKELETLEQQISTKLQSNEPIDVEYWEHLLGSVTVYKARAELNDVYKAVIESRLNGLRQEQCAEAGSLKAKLALLLQDSGVKGQSSQAPAVRYSRSLDPEPLLKLRAEDKGLDLIEESDFVNKLVRTITPRLQKLTDLLTILNRWLTAVES